MRPKYIKEIYMKTKLMALLLLLTLSLPVSAMAGTVSGKVALTGTVPEAATIDMNADPFCAGAHTEAVKTEEVVVNSNGTLKNAFVYVKAGLEGKTFDTPSAPVQLDQKGCHYTPHVFGVQVNQEVEIINSDSTLHNVHGMPKESKEFNLGMPIQGMKPKRKFDKPEVMVHFKCDVHPWMSAYAGVLPHPFFAVTGEDGTFKIENLPAGKYTIEVWQEKYGVQTQEVTVDEAGVATADFSFAG